jgi:hypothetical protein
MVVSSTIFVSKVFVALYKFLEFFAFENSVDRGKQ